MKELRPFQSELKQKIYTSWGSGHRNVLAVLPTGGGKTILVSDIVRDGFNDNQMPQAIIAHRNELVTQMSLALAEQGVPHRIIGADTTVSQANQKHREELGKSFVVPNAPTAVIGVDTLMARSQHLEKWAKQIHRWTVDECFPAGTMISTASGAVAIETLNIGDFVIAFDEKNKSFSEKKISRLFKNLMPKNMVRLITTGHHVIESTCNHPFWTRRGWVDAVDLTIEDEVLNVPMQPLCKPEKNSRQQERYVFDFIGLESIEIFKPSDNDRASDGFVYNIEVDELHTYVANEIVVHNCHHLIGNDSVERNKWGKAVQMFSNAYGLGVTATPVRADGKGLGREYDGVMDDMVVGPSMRWLIENNYLCDYDIVCPDSDMHVSEDEVSADGDWSSKTLRKAAKKSHIVGDVVQNYGKYAFGRSAIVFATDVETANEIAEGFRTWGVRAEALSAKSLSSWRDQCLKEFKTGKMQVLINVDLFDEGFNAPGCDVVIMARPTASLGKYLQMVGRALRYQPGKVARIIDHVSNVTRHLLPDRTRVWTLARRDKRGKQEIDPEMIGLQVCKQCTKPFDKFRTVCPYCGFEKPLPEPRSRSIEMVEGDLVLLDRAALAAMRARMNLESAADVGKRVAAAAGPIAGKGAANRQMEKIAAHTELSEAIAQWAGIQRARGLNDREISRKFYHAMGVDVLSVLDGSQTRTELEALANRIKGWYS